LGCPDRKALAGDQKDVVVVTTVHTKDVPVPQARPARAVQLVNTMSGAFEDEWVDVGQMGAATRGYSYDKKVCYDDGSQAHRAELPRLAQAWQPALREGSRGGLGLGRT